MSKTGFCSVCRSEKVKVVNEVIEAGGSFNEALVIAQENGFTFSKGTFFRHKTHITSALITDAEAARKNPVVLPKSNKAVLEAIRDLGMRKAVTNPESVTVNQALRAASILNEKETKQDSVIVVLAKALQQQHDEPEIPEISGEYHEVPRLESKVKVMEV